MCFIKTFLLYISLFFFCCTARHKSKTLKSERSHGELKLVSHVYTYTVYCISIVYILIDGLVCSMHWEIFNGGARLSTYCLPPLYPSESIHRPMSCLFHALTHSACLLTFCLLLLSLFLSF